MLNSSIRPRTRSLTRGWVTPKSRAARVWVRPRALISCSMAIMRHERTARCSASPGGKPRSRNALPDEGVTRVSSPEEVPVIGFDFGERRSGRATALALRGRRVVASLELPSRMRGARSPLLETLRRAERDAPLRRESESRIHQLLSLSSAASPPAPSLTGRAPADSRPRVARLARRHGPLAANDQSRIGASRRIYKILYDWSGLLTSVLWVRISGQQR